MNIFGILLEVLSDISKVAIGCFIALFCWYLLMGD